MSGWGENAGGGGWTMAAEATPVRSYEEDWATGSSAKASGGFENDVAEFASKMAQSQGQEVGANDDFYESKPAGNCFNCGQEGHSKADCPNPRVFKGACRICEQEGHPAAECPEKPAEKCRNCNQEGHKAVDCENKRVIDFTSVADKSEEDAWADIVRADRERDLGDLREAIQVLQKVDPNLTYHGLETRFRQKGLKTNVIAYEKDITDTFTLMDLNGQTGRQYHIGYYWSAKPPRANLSSAWPESPEQNLERLQNAGYPVDKMIPKCGNCGELGHISKSCTIEKQERERLEVKCVNCKEVGHRARDCTQQRVDRFACRNCKQPGHDAKECPEPRSAEGVECKNCNQLGHFSRDCPNREPELCRNCGEEGHRARDCEKPRVQKCRNCDEEGHISKECPKPRDWSRVKCSNCEEMGHGRGRCPKPLKEESFDSGYGAGGNDTSVGGALEPAVSESGDAGGVALDSGANDGW